MAVRQRPRILVENRRNQYVLNRKGGRKVIVVHTSPKPFWDGIARIFDFTGALTTPPSELPPEVCDMHALQEDWKTVGNDLRTVIGRQIPSSDSSRTSRSAQEIA